MAISVTSSAWAQSLRQIASDRDTEGPRPLRERDQRRIGRGGKRWVKAFARSLRRRTGSWLVAIGVLIAVLLPVADASARTTIDPESDSAARYQGWVDETKFPTPNVTLRVHEGRPEDGVERCGAPVLGCATADWIFVSWAGWKQTFMHELGHVFDFVHLTNPRRARFLRIVRRPDVDWWPDAGEWFADAYERCVRPGPIRKWRQARTGRAPRFYTFGPIVIKGVRMKRACKLMRRAYRDPIT